METKPRFIKISRSIQILHLDSLVMKNKMNEMIWGAVFLIIMIFWFFIDYLIVIRYLDYYPKSEVVDILKAVEVVILILKSYSIILVITSLSLIILYWRVKSLRSKLKILLIITFILDVVSIFFLFQFV